MVGTVPYDAVLDAQSVIKYEGVIHEFDPYFNYRVTQVHGLWFMVRVWDTQNFLKSGKSMFHHLLFPVTALAPPDRACLRSNEDFLKLSF
ncbi:hypothetical protein L1887_17901 [Cichorium endivia]|nr:hypothetical protein L1887_17901 [Cichorium endivia]